MRPWRAPRAALIAVALCAAPAAAQQPLPAGAELPPGHPPLDAPGARVTGSASAVPTASSAPPGAGSALPPGHPRVAGSPHGEGKRGFVAPADRAAPADDVPRGAIDVEIRDGDDQPHGGVEVRLGILRQSIAEGESREERSARADAGGKLRFSELGIGSALSYRVTVQSGAASYASAPFNLGEDRGHRVVLHVYPVTRRLERALVGMRGFVFVEPRDDLLQLEVMFRLFNIGAVTWVPEGVRVELPKRAKAVTAPESMSDVRFVADGERVRLEGSITPGQHDASYRFQIPHDGDSDVELRVPLPPHVAEMQVIVESTRGMSLKVAGFEAATPGDLDGRHVLAASRQLVRGAAPLEALEIAIGGMPTQGQGRWWAVAIAVGIVAAGGSVALRRPGIGTSGRAASDRTREARDLLLEEAVRVERAFRAGRIGPKTREQARRLLLAALARLPEPAVVEKSGKSLRKRSDQRRERRAT
jgi:hypothetical protein